MIRRLYAHNYRCLQNTDVDLAGRSSVLLVGSNGSGKSSLLEVLESLRSMARGRNRANEMVRRRAVSALEASEADETPPLIRFEIESELPGGSVARYSLGLELPPGFREYRVADESLTAGECDVFRRTLADVTFTRSPGSVATFAVDWHQVALPVIGTPGRDHPLEAFRRELSRLVILRPAPGTMSGEGSEGVSVPEPDCRDFGAWFRETTMLRPAVYAPFLAFLRNTMPDLVAVQNTPAGRETRTLEFVFQSPGGRTFALPFEELSDGEKSLSVAAMVCGIAEAGDSTVFAWDEPDSHIALGEVQHLIAGIRKRLGNSQLIATSHHPETIRAFSSENTLLVYRRSHSDPSRVRSVSELIGPERDLAEALERGDILA